MNDMGEWILRLVQRLQAFCFTLLIFFDKLLLALLATLLVVIKSLVREIGRRGIEQLRERSASL